MRTLILFAASLLLASTVLAQANSSADSSGWSKLVDEFFDTYFDINPSQGTASGFHQYDTKLEDYSRAGVDKQIAWANEWLSRVQKFDSQTLTPEQRQDYQLVENTLKSTLLDLQNVRGWEKNPDRYSSGITNSSFIIMARNFAPAADRLRSLIARERQMPAVFDAARHNLKNPPKIYTEVAIQQVPGITSFFQKDVPAAFKDVTDKQLLLDFKTSNDAVITALEKYLDFLKHDLLPISDGDFRIGEDNYRKKLAYDEMVDIPLDRLLEIGYADLHRNQAEFKRVAAQIDPKKTPQQILDELQKDHPAPDKLPAGVP